MEKELILLINTTYIFEDHQVLEISKMKVSYKCGGVKMCNISLWGVIKLKYKVKQKQNTLSQYLSKST